MFVVSMKTTRSRLLGVLLAAALVLFILLMQGCLPSEETGTVPMDGSSDEGRRACLTALGYQLATEPPQVREVLFPAEPDDVWLAYNALQQQAGTDLTPYRGQRVKCYTYTVLNYPGDETVEANVYIYKDQVIGGDISSTRQGGFRHGLIRKDGQSGATG